jgi:2-polyprenyl-3-methyl-5-hydroxy-6-metoxy-1,4-benzoquinol methylase
MDNFEKNPDYFANTRAEILPYLEGKFAKSLDVGCGAGLVSAALRERGLVKEAHGVELSPNAKAEAAKKLDRVFAEDLSASEPKEILGPYDLVLCLDVLEHMYDPWTALRRIRKLLGPQGTLLVSIPNVRNFRASFPLLIRGDWKYDEAGILDSTHIRFFTKKTARQLVEGAGFEIVKIGSSGKQPYSKTWWANLFTLNLLREFFEIQYFIVAKPKS